MENRDKLGKRIAVIAALIIFFALAALNVWFLAKQDSLQQQVNDLTAANNDLLDQIERMTENNSLLQWRLNNLAEDYAETLNLTKRIHIFSVEGGSSMPIGYVRRIGFTADRAGYVSVWVDIRDLESQSSVSISATYNFANQIFNFTKTYYPPPFNSFVSRAPALIAPILPSNVTITIRDTNMAQRPLYRYGIYYYY